MCIYTFSDILIDFVFFQLYYLLSQGFVELLFILMVSVDKTHWFLSFLFISNFLYGQVLFYLFQVRVNYLLVPSLTSLNFVSGTNLIILWHYIHFWVLNITNSFVSESRTICCVYFINAGLEEISTRFTIPEELGNSRDKFPSK